MVSLNTVLDYTVIKLVTHNFSEFIEGFWFLFFYLETSNYFVVVVASEGVPPHKANFIEDLVVMLPQNIWDNLYSR